MLLAVSKENNTAEDDVDRCCEEGRRDEEEDRLHDEGPKGPNIVGTNYTADVS